MSDIETLYDNQDRKMPCQRGNRGLSDVGAISNINSQEICVRC